MKNNCYDIEAVYFQLDQSRKGFFDRYDLRVFVLENGGSFTEEELNLMMSFFDRSALGMVRFDDFIS